MKVCIVGCSGFIGSSLSEYINNIRNFTVTGISRSKLRSVMRDSDIAEEILKYDYDFIYFMSEPASLNFKPNNSESNFLEVLASNYGKKLIYLSSSLVYGKSSLESHLETDARNGFDIYSNQKIMNENIVRKYESRIIRLSNVYGKGMSDKKLLSKYLQDFKFNGEVTINANPTRDYISIQQVVSGLTYFMDSDFDVLNLGTGKGISMLNLFKQLNKEFRNFKVSFKSTNNEKEPVDCCISNVTKMKNLGFNIEFDKKMREL